MCDSACWLTKVKSKYIQDAPRTTVRVLFAQLRRYSIDAGVVDDDWSDRHREGEVIDHLWVFFHSTVTGPSTILPIYKVDCGFESQSPPFDSCCWLAIILSSCSRSDPHPFHMWSNLSAYTDDTHSRALVTAKR